MSRPGLVALGGALVCLAAVGLLVAFGSRMAGQAPPSLPCSANASCPAPPRAAQAGPTPTPPPLEPPAVWNTRNGD